MLTKALVLFVPVSLLLAYSIAEFGRHRTPSLLQILGAACLVVVVLTHIAEALRLSGVGWGEPHSVGHYLDLTSAVLGVTLLAIAVVLRLLLTRTL
jgi:succinate dehydrogenase/fumarate reductase cytochrome b subunit